MARFRTRRIAFGLLIVAVVLFGVVVRALIIAMQPPTFSCSTPNASACIDTERWITSDPQMVFAGFLPARLLAVDVRPTPPEWGQPAVDAEGGWAVLLTMEGREPTLMACYYSSDDMVGCSPH